MTLQKSLNGTLAVKQLTLEVAWGAHTTVTVDRTDNKQNCCTTEEECEELRLRRDLPLVAITTM